MRVNRVYPVELARASGVSRQNLAKIRAGRADPHRRAMAAILEGINIVLARDVTITDLFAFDDGPLPAARADWSRIPRPGRPPKKPRPED